MTYGACTDYPLQDNLAATFSGLSTILPRRSGRSWQCREAKGNNKVKYNILGFRGLVIFVVTTLLILHAITTLLEPHEIWKTNSF